MTKALLFSLLVFLAAACGPAQDVSPTLSSEVAGTYQTNGFLDYLRITLPADKMPVATLTRETDATVTLTYLQQYPTPATQTITNIQLNRLADNSIELIQQGTVLGSVRPDRAFSNNGMERQALVLRLQQPSKTGITFTGARE